MDGCHKCSCPQRLSGEACRLHAMKEAPVDVHLRWNGLRDLQNVCSSVSMACDIRRQSIVRKVAETLEIGSRLASGVKLPNLTLEPLHGANRNVAKDGQSQSTSFLSLASSAFNNGAFNSNAASGDKSIQRRRPRGHNANGHHRDPSVIIWWSAVNHLAFTFPRLPKPLSGLAAWRPNAHIQYSHIHSLMAPLAALARALRSMPWAPTMRDSGALCFARITPLRVREAQTPASRR